MATTPLQPRSSNGHAQTPRISPLKGDDAVPKGLAVASAITLRALILLAGVLIVALGAARMMLVVLPVIISVLLATLLCPLARRLEARRWRRAPAALASTLLAVLVFFGLWALIIPGVLTQSDDLFTNLQDGATQAVSVLEPLGVGRGDLDKAIDQGLSSVQGGAIANEVMTGAVLLTQWAAAVVLIVVLTFFLIKDGAQIWDWLLELFHEDRQPVLREVGARAWTALSAYVQGVFLVATIDAVLIGAALLIMGVPVAMPLIVLTFIAAFFPIVGAFVAGRRCRARRAGGERAPGRPRDPRGDRARPAARGERLLSGRRRAQAAAAPGRHPARAHDRRSAGRRRGRVPRDPDGGGGRGGARLHARAARGAPVSRCACAVARTASSR